MRTNLYNQFDPRSKANFAPHGSYEHGNSPRMEALNSPNPGALPHVSSVQGLGGGGEAELASRKADCVAGGPRLQDFGYAATLGNFLEHSDEDEVDADAILHFLF